MDADRWSCRGSDVAIYSAMVAVEISNVGLNTLFEAATSEGMSSYVFVVYSFALGALLLLLTSLFFSRRSRPLPPLSLSIICKMGLLGLLGSVYQMAGYTGLKYSSPTLSSAISNLIPAFTFILAILFRMEKISLDRKSSVAKAVGAIASIGGALVATLYHGPLIFVASQPSANYFRQSLPSPPSPPSDSMWALGGALLTIKYSLKSASYIIQANVLSKYPSEMTMTLVYFATVPTFCASVTAFAENPSAWIIGSQISLLCILASGILNPGYYLIQSWAVRQKGPVFVAMFRPLSIIIAIAMDAIFLGNSLYLGSLIGGTLISIGFYTVMWGKAKEAKANADPHSTDSPTLEKIPLLMNYKDEQV